MPKQPNASPGGMAEASGPADSDPPRLTSDNLGRHTRALEEVDEDSPAFHRIREDRSASARSALASLGITLPEHVAATVFVTFEDMMPMDRFLAEDENLQERLMKNETTDKGIDGNQGGTAC
jgi:hypothetical protein